MPTWYCIDILKRNSVLVSYGSNRVNWKVHSSYRQVLCIALLKNPLAHNHYFFKISLKGSFSSSKVFFIKWKYLTFWTILRIQNYLFKWAPREYIFCKMDGLFNRILCIIIRSKTLKKKVTKRSVCFLISHLPSPIVHSRARNSPSRSVTLKFPGSISISN